jgi:hypothetical protein
MANKKFWLGILVMVLVFGMTVSSCDTTQTDTTPTDDYHKPEFNGDVTVFEIPENKNGQSFTMSLIANSKTVASSNGIIAGNKAEASFILAKFPEGNYGYDILGYPEYRCYLGLKIGYEPIKVSTDEIGFGLADDGTHSGYQPLYYSDLFGGN